MRALLDQIEKFKSSVYKTVFFAEVDGEEAIVVTIAPRKSTKPVCRVRMMMGASVVRRGRRDLDGLTPSVVEGLFPVRATPRRLLRRWGR